jgi:processing peptidase subunit beta
VTVDMVKQFHANHYISPNISIVATGGVDHNKLMALAEKHFSAFPIKPPSPPAEIMAPIYTPSMITIRDDAKLNTNVGVFFDAPCWKHEDYIPFILLERMFGLYSADSNSAAVIKDVDQVYNSMHSAIRKLPVSKVQAVYSPYREGGIIGNYMNGEYHGTREMLKAALTLPSIYSDYLDQLELYRTKNKFYFDLLQIECPEDMMMLYSQQMMNIGRIITKPELAKRVAAVTRTHLQNVCKEWFYDEEPVIVAWGPHADEMGTYETYRSLTRERLTLKNMNWHKLK